eukprot:6932888-Prymnesium_polylepis.1
MSCAVLAAHVGNLLGQPVEAALRLLQLGVLLGDDAVGGRAVLGDQHLVLVLGRLDVGVQLATRALVLATQRGKGALDGNVFAHLLVLAQLLQLEAVAAVVRADAVLGIDESTEHRGRHPDNLVPGPVLGEDHVLAALRAERLGPR